MRSSTEHLDGQPARTVLTVATNGGLSARGKVLAAVLTALLLLGLGVGLAMANALPVLGGRAVSETQAGTATDPERLGTGTVTQGAHVVGAEAIQAEWDGPAVHLDWTGAEYARAETTFIGTRTASPGDAVRRTLLITNAGPGDGVAAVTLDVTELIPEGATNTHFSDDVQLFWSIDGVVGEENFTVLKTGDRQTVAEVAVTQGATIPVMFGFSMDEDAAAPQLAGGPSVDLSFDVGVNLTGNTDTPPLVVTGGTGAMLLIAIAVALLLIGWFVIAAARRRTAEEQSTTVVESHE
ncbi:hypothetical protein ICM05_10355 [Leucobacter sp. cx-42]|uniref:hypothetical protein n=1 Tax=unclassified Leucobacter TaxID=2621730 RepID=UPI00165E6F8C|nr:MULTISPECIES: hypothetical protein [unclassified Leucobacter]MBC9955033.1 hypothetical protein [Leucobacter sp. cx-42]